MATGYSKTPENESGIRSSLDCQQMMSEPFSTLIQTTELPVIVKYDSSSPLDERQVTPAFDPSEPLLVHSKHKVRRIRARCVQFQSESRTFMDCDCDAVIPEVYRGWFAVFGNPSTQNRDPIVPHYRRVSQLAISTCTRFLVAGDRPSNVLLAKQGEGEQVDFHPSSIYPGTVLQKGKLFSLFSHYTKVKKGFRKKAKKKVREDKYLSAYDGCGHTFFISCDLEGLFYVLETQTAHLSIPVLRFQDVIQRYKFPVLVKLVQGRIPSSSSSFNGTLVLFESQLTSFAITFNLKLHKEMIFEILEDSSLPFILSAPQDNESEEYGNALACHKSHGDFLLQNIRFQYRTTTSDHTYVKDSAGNTDFSNFTEEKHRSRRPEISGVRIEDFQLFPPSPATSKVVGDDKVPHSVLSFNLKEIKRTVTFDRPRDIKFDTIPIESRGVVARASRTSASSLDEERRASDTTNTSSASQPSLHGLAISGSEETGSEEKEEDLPPPPAVFLHQSESVEDEDVPENVPPSETWKHPGMWSEDTLNKGSTLSVEADGRDGVRLPDKGDNKMADEENGCPNRSGTGARVDEDENGYVIASDLTLPLDAERSRRPASYVSIHPLENHYDRCIIPDRSSERSESNGYDYPSISGEIRGLIRARDGTISFGSHYYASLEEPSFEEVENAKPKYVNIPFLETGAVNGAGGHKNIYDVPRIFEDQTTTHIPTQNGQSAISQELTSREWKEVLRQTSASSAGTSSGYVNLQDIIHTNHVAASYKDKLLDRLKQQDLKKNTQDALMALNEDDFASMAQADEPLDRLKELLPQISKSDVFKIGLCLKDI